MKKCIVKECYNKTLIPHTVNLRSIPICDGLGIPSDRHAVKSLERFYRQRPVIHQSTNPLAVLARRRYNLVDSLDKDGFITSGWSVAEK